jgi:hypothetical protein
MGQKQVAVINTASVGASGHKTSPRALGILNQMFVPEAQAIFGRAIAPAASALMSA